MINQRKHDEQNQKSIPKMFLFVEGNIGSGKSTFLDLCAANSALFKPHFDDVVVLQENVADWMLDSVSCPGYPSQGSSGGGHKSIFDLFYENKERYAFTFQSYVLLSRISSMIEMADRYANDNRSVLVLCERSIMTDLEIFAKGLAASGDMSPSDMLVYRKWHALVQKISSTAGVPSADKTLYLRCPPDVSFSRMCTRGRAGEESITYEYIAELHKRHDDWLLDGSRQVLVIDATPDFGAEREALEGVVACMVEFIAIKNP